MCFPGKFRYKNKSLLLSKALTPLKPLIQACFELIKLRTSVEITTICRRLAGICFNDGLALNLLYDLNFLLTEDDQYKDMTLPCLDAFVSQFNAEAVEQEEIEAIEKSLEIPLFNLSKFVLKSDSEAQFRTMFWDSILTTLFFEASISSEIFREDSEIEFILMSEWPSKKLFPELETRKVDFAALWSEIPLMIIEMGKEGFGVGVNSHKDFTKSLALISQSCRKLALKLEAQGKGAENAKCFGIWIGGTQICTFHYRSSYCT